MDSLFEFIARFELLFTSVFPVAFLLTLLLFMIEDFKKIETKKLHIVAHITGYFFEKQQYQSLFDVVT